MCAPKFLTPGTAISSRLARSVMRRIASIDVPGFSTQCMRKSYSRKLGRNSSPRNGTVNVVTSSSTASEPSAVFGRSTKAGSICRYRALSPPTSRDSRVSRCFGRRSSANAGVTVSATASDARIAST